MVDIFENINEETFSWETMGDVVKGRTHLGTEVPLVIHRLLQFTLKEELNRRFGKKMSKDIFRSAGECAGSEFAKNMLNLNLPYDDFIAQLQEVLQKYKMGILRVEKLDFNEGVAVLTISEDIDCSGLPITGETVCHYEEGFLAGVFKIYTQRKCIVKEVDCWSTGSTVCRFEAQIEV